jgi:hypothetical protein
VIQLLHTSFLVLDAKGGVRHLFIYLSIYHVWNSELHVFGFGTMACNNSLFVCV